MQKLVSAAGILVFVGLCWLLSRDRRAIRWHTVAVGLLLQLVLGLLFLLWAPGNALMFGFSEGVKEFLDLSLQGSAMLFGSLTDFRFLAERWGPQQAFLMAFQVLPTIIFFSSFLAILYHYGVMQRVVQALAWLMVRLMRTSGSESLSVSGNIFVGQTEAPLLVRPFLASMTQSELFAVMVGGFATIAGGVFALYVGMLEQAGMAGSAGHLVVASVMSAPAALVVAKLMFPETGHSQTLGRVEVRLERTAHNGVEAAANGALDGLKLALNVAAMLIAFVSLLALANWLLAGFRTPAEVEAERMASALDAPGFLPALLDRLLSGPAPLPDPDAAARLAEAAGRAVLGFDEPLSVQWMLGKLFAPLAFMLGVEPGDVTSVGSLLGVKIAANEFVAYQELAVLVQQHRIGERSARIATYALCGFANFGSVAIQIGGISALAPERKGDLARLGVLAMIGGAFASWMTACVVGVLQ
ncbi:MAG: nucleoside transporter C-terminal domain-containing protein [Planctomycetota bacterium]